MIPTIRTPEDGTYEVEPTEDGLYLYHDAGQVTLIHVPTRYAAQLGEMLIRGAAVAMQMQTVETAQRELAI
jgi:hypothetical protein